MEGIISDESISRSLAEQVAFRRPEQHGPVLVCRCFDIVVFCVARSPRRDENIKLLFNFIWNSRKCSAFGTVIIRSLMQESWSYDRVQLFEALCAQQISISSGEKKRIIYGNISMKRRLFLNENTLSYSSQILRASWAKSELAEAVDALPNILNLPKLRTNSACLLESQWISAQSQSRTSMSKNVWS
jgi:hypothetical protein